MMVFYVSSTIPYYICGRYLYFFLLLFRITYAAGIWVISTYSYIEVVYSSPSQPVAKVAIGRSGVTILPALRDSMFNGTSFHGNSSWPMGKSGSLFSCMLDAVICVYLRIQLNFAWDVHLDSFPVPIAIRWTEIFRCEDHQSIQEILFCTRN